MVKMSTYRLDIFLEAYLDALEWTEVHNDNPELMGSLGFSSELLDAAKNDCMAFLAVAGDMIPDDLLSQAGHDFWLTRNGHGTGFWDRPEIWGSNADKLTDLCGWGTKFSEFWVYLGDDNLIYGGSG
jgi:hypothetical protein